MSGFESPARDPKKAQLRVRLRCLSCSNFNEVGRVYDGDQPGDLLIRGRGRALDISGEWKFIGGDGPVGLIPDPDYPATLKLAPMRSIAVRQAEVPSLLLEVFCKRHGMRRVRGEQIAEGVAKALDSGRPVRVGVRIFSETLPAQ
jgi:hypothetical protein